MERDRQRISIRDSERQIEMEIDEERDKQRAIGRKRERYIERDIDNRQRE